MFSWKSPSDGDTGHVSVLVVGVSILVFVEVALGHGSGGSLQSRHRVSILVFVEVALGHSRPASNRQANLSFNPCFRGSRPRTLEEREILERQLAMFQSLFSWKSPSDLVASVSANSTQGVSILVFVEVALGLK